MSGKENIAGHIALIFILLFCMHAQAQLNRKDTLAWHISLAASGSFLDGNVARLLLVNRLEVAYATRVWGMSSRNDYQYGTTRNLQTDNDIVSYNFFYLHPLARIYPYIMVIAETNYRRKIRFRSQVGPGVSYTIPVKSDDILLVSLTGTYENTRFSESKFTNLSDTLSSVINVWRVTGRLFGKQLLFNKNMSISYEFWWQQSVSDYRNHRFYNEEIFEIPLNRSFSFRTGFRLSYENVRVYNLKPYDLFLTFGFVVSKH